MTNQQQVVYDLLERFPKAASWTLARRAYKEHTALWPNLEACRKAFRRARGANGKRDRRLATHARTEVPDAPFAAIPEGWTQLPSIIGLEVPGPCTALVLSDVHIPFHDRGSLELALTEGSRRKTDVILLNGDILDAHALSRWETDPRERDFADEIDKLRTFFSVLRSGFPKARIIWKYGNHELRHTSYMVTKAPELLDIADFSLPNVARCEEHGIEVVEELQIIKIGKLNCIHGHCYRFAISNPVNPARGLFLRARVNALCGHFHQVSQHSENDMNGHITSCWSTGCLSDLHPRYSPLNRWSHGFAIVGVDENGAFDVTNYRVIDGKIWT